MASRRPLLKTLVAVAALALVATACGGGGGKKAASNATTTSVQDTSTTVADTSTTAAGGSTATTKAGQKPATTAGARVNGQPAGNYQPPAGSKAATPATPGTYRYDTSGSSKFGAQTSSPPPVTTLTVDPPQGTRQHSTRDTRTPDGNGSVTETTLDFLPQGVYLVELKITSKATIATDVTDLVANPPALVGPTGAKPGTGSVEFDLSGSGTNVHVKIDFLRNERLTIGGQGVDTLLSHQVATLSGKLSGTQASDTWVSQQYNLTVKDHTVADVTAYGAQLHSDITSTLQKVTPG
jgi:hypothetical protein